MTYLFFERLVNYWGYFRKFNMVVSNCRCLKAIFESPKVKSSFHPFLLLPLLLITLHHFCFKFIFEPYIEKGEYVVILVRASNEVMEPLFDQFNAFAESSHDFFDSIFGRRKSVFFLLFLCTPYNCSLECRYKN